MKAQVPFTQFSLWRNDQLFNIDFSEYTLSHHSFPRHFHDHFVIELVLSGTDHFYCNGNNYMAETNQLVLINPGEVHTGSTLTDIPLRYFSFYPDAAVFREMAEVLAITIPHDFIFQLTLQHQSVISEKLKQLYHSFVSGAELLQLQQVFYDCMYALLMQDKKDTAGTIKKDPRIGLVIDFIHTNFTASISLKEMAALISLNPFHFLRLFKKNTGVSPHEYLLIVRTGYAQRLLRKGYKVEEAALEAGFYDTSHFNRSLRKIAGTSPRSFLSPKGQYRTSIIGQH
jgi:AraC-like DNA-binding protein/mannose-6-phosphate isomerase-like protein (cupin superfamily)